MSNRNPPDHGAAMFGGMAITSMGLPAAWGGDKPPKPPSGRGPRSPGVGGLTPVRVPTIGDLGRPKPPAKPAKGKGQSGPIA